LLLPKPWNITISGWRLPPVLGSVTSTSSGDPSKLFTSPEQILSPPG
jgi:hypothetical protein